MLQLCKATTLQGHNSTPIQVYNARLQLYKATTLHQCNSTMLQLYNNKDIDISISNRNDNNNDTNNISAPLQLYKPTH